MKLKPRTEKFIHIGDGITANGREQIGKRVDYEGITGTVVDATDLTVTVRWDFRSWLRYSWAGKLPEKGSIK